ncbi:MAG: biotin-dependent carboxyltransferase family protein [Caldiserica bacterium]|jgi:biotin-dependent carboxylase-like uncharacterized protein|nr:biotin-dependent carboxyltransferase family protein [Caldisericota bacterium]MDH7562450.1 biotin-dependent carboxyltransferase family protein [Caldisericota bacterium]
MGIPFLKVIQPGPLTTVQDLGRFGYLKFGLPPAGAADELSFRVANALVGNPPDSACIELTVAGGKFQALEGSTIAITGGNMKPKINGLPVSGWESLTLKEGDLLEFSLVSSGCRSYISVAGGIDVPQVLGSRSTYLLGNIGGFLGRPLKEGDTLLRGESSKALPRIFPKHFIPQFPPQIELRVLLGPQEDHFSSQGLKTFLQEEYRVSPHSNRMGYRLEGPQIETLKKGIISDAIPLGSVQVSGDGQPIILLWDRQTTGGYPKIAVVIRPDIWKIAQAKPGDGVFFKKVGMEEALSLYGNYRSFLSSLDNLVQ